MQETLTKVDSKVFVVVASHSQLSLNLLLGCSKSLLRQRLFHQSLELALYQSHASVHIVWVATEVY